MEQYTQLDQWKKLNPEIDLDTYHHPIHDKDVTVTLWKKSDLICKWFQTDVCGVEGDVDLYLTPCISTAIPHESQT